MANQTSENPFRLSFISWNLKIFPDFFQYENQPGKIRIDGLVDGMLPGSSFDIAHFQEVWAMPWEAESSNYLRSRLLGHAGDNDALFSGCSSILTGSHALDYSRMNAGVMTCWGKNLQPAEFCMPESVAANGAMMGPYVFKEYMGLAALQSGGSSSDLQVDYVNWTLLALALAAMIAATVAGLFLAKEQKKAASRTDRPSASRRNALGDELLSPVTDEAPTPNREETNHKSLCLSFAFIWSVVSMLAFAWMFAASSLSSTLTGERGAFLGIDAVFLGLISSVIKVPARVSWDGRTDAISIVVLSCVIMIWAIVCSLVVYGRPAQYRNACCSRSRRSKNVPLSVAGCVQASVFACNCATVIAFLLFCGFSVAAMGVGTSRYYQVASSGGTTSNIYAARDNGVSSPSMFDSERGCYNTVFAFHPYRYSEADDSIPTKGAMAGLFKVDSDESGGDRRFVLSINTHTQAMSDEPPDEKTGHYTAGERRRVLANLRQWQEVGLFIKIVSQQVKAQYGSDIELSVFFAGDSNVMRLNVARMLQLYPEDFAPIFSDVASQFTNSHATEMIAQRQTGLPSYDSSSGLENYGYLELHEETQLAFAPTLKQVAQLNEKRFGTKASLAAAIAKYRPALTLETVARMCLREQALGFQKSVNIRTTNFAAKGAEASSLVATGAQALGVQKSVNIRTTNFAAEGAGASSLFASRETASVNESECIELMSAGMYLFYESSDGSTITRWNLFKTDLLDKAFIIPVDNKQPMVMDSWQVGFPSSSVQQNRWLPMMRPGLSGSDSSTLPLQISDHLPVTGTFRWEHNLPPLNFGYPTGDVGPLLSRLTHSEKVMNEREVAFDGGIWRRMLYYAPFIFWGLAFLNFVTFVSVYQFELSKLHFEEGMSQAARCPGLSLSVVDSSQGCAAEAVSVAGSDSIV